MAFPPQTLSLCKVSFCKSNIVPFSGKCVATREHTLSPLKSQSGFPKAQSNSFVQLTHSPSDSSNFLALEKALCSLQPPGQRDSSVPSKHLFWRPGLKMIGGNVFSTLLKEMHSKIFIHPFGAAWSFTDHNQFLEVKTEEVGSKVKFLSFWCWKGMWERIQLASGPRGRSRVGNTEGSKQTLNGVSKVKGKCEITTAFSW